MGSAFHARAAQQPDAPDLWNRLTPEEQEEVSSWKVPYPVRLGETLLDYSAAAIEDTIAVHMDGSASDGNPGCDYPTEILTLGHVDMYWVVGKTVYVGDIKRSRWTTSGPDSLQLQAYGYGLAQLFGCDAFVSGIWDATNGGWYWAQPFDMNANGGVLFERIRSAALHESPRPVVGSYCSECYGTQHCKAFVLHAAAAETVLAPLAEGQELTAENAAQVVVAYDALRKLVGDDGPVRRILRDFAEKNGGITDPATGRVWKPIESAGRESVSVKRVREVFGEQAEQVVSKSGPVFQYRWVKP